MPLHDAGGAGRSASVARGGRRRAAFIRPDAGDRLAGDRLADDRLADDRLADDRLADDRLADDRPGETPFERADRNFGELLQELRVAQTGVQILFAGLLSIPFQQRFQQLGDGDRTLYVVAILSAAFASACITAPVSIHRVLFRRRRKQDLVDAASRLATVGLVFLAVSVVASLAFVLDVLLPGAAAYALAAVVAVVIIVLWYVLPLTIRHRILD